MEQRFTPSVHRLALWAGGPVMTVLYLVGWLAFARMIPTPDPDWTPEELSAWLVERKPEMLIGCLLMIAGCGLWGTWVAAITVWTFRTESRYPVLSFTQLICVAAGLTFFIFDTLFWSVAVYRAGEINPEITQTMWDIGWFGFLFTITVYIAWAVAWALGVLLNPPEYQIFPRWTAYMTLASVCCWAPGLLQVFFKHGPFSYSGVGAMWLPIGEFFVWLVFLDIAARKAIKRQVALSIAEGEARGAEYGIWPQPETERVPDSASHLNGAHLSPDADPTSSSLARR